MPGGPTEDALRQRLVLDARRLYERGLITALDGNLSVRFGGRWVLATPAARAKMELEPGDLVLLDLGPGAARGQTIPSQPRVARARRGFRPSSELAMHLAVYGARPDVQAVVHAHPPTAVGLTMHEPRPRLDICPESVVFLGDVGFARYGTPGTHDLAESIAPLLASCDTILLTRHGAVTVGPSPEAAYQRMEVLEHVSRIYLAARQIGPVEPLPEHEKSTLRRLAGLPEPAPRPSADAEITRHVEAILRCVLDTLACPPA